MFLLSNLNATYDVSSPTCISEGVICRSRQQGTGRMEHANTVFTLSCCKRRHCNIISSQKWMGQTGNLCGWTDGCSDGRFVGWLVGLRSVRIAYHIRALPFNDVGSYVTLQTSFDKLPQTRGPSKSNNMLCCCSQMPRKFLIWYSPRYNVKKSPQFVVHDVQIVKNTENICILGTDQPENLDCHQLELFSYVRI